MHKVDLINYGEGVLIKYFYEVNFLGDPCGNICSFAREKAKNLTFNSMLQTSIELIKIREIHHFFKRIFREEDLTKSKFPGILCSMQTCYFGASLVAQSVKNPPIIQETQV